MNKSKKIISLVAAATLALSTFALTACDSKGYKGENLSAGYDAAATVSSNGGFVVEKGDYVYFINGAEVNTANNTYGNPVKGSLMRISKSQLAAGEYGEAQIVIPSLFVTGNYDSGIYIYGDKIYYATPTTAKNNEGQIENSYLDFKWSTLDGKSAPSKHFLRLSSNVAKYRFVEVDGVVYCLYEEDSALKSYNVSTGKTTVLVKGAGAFIYDKQDLTSPNVYYTMDVSYELDSDNATKANYNQIYCVNAAATAVTNKDAASYAVYEGEEKIAEYDFDETYLKDKAKEDEDSTYDAGDYTTYPYVNLGKLVLDGVGSAPSFAEDTRYNKDDASASLEPLGYKYTLQSQGNGGLYFTRTAGTTNAGETAKLYYVANERGSWNTVTGNGDVDTVAIDTTSASATAIFEKAEDGTHSYLYLSGSILKKATTDENGKATTVDLAYGVSSITLWKTEGDYLYYYGSGTNGNNLTRINYKGTADKYNPLLLTDEYKPQTLALVDWNDSWFKPEFVDANGATVVMYSNAQSFGDSGTAYNYVYAAKLGDTASIIAANDNLEKVNEYIESYKDNSELQDVMTYYFRTGKLTAYEAVIDLYDEYQQEETTAFVEKFKEGGEFENMLESDFIGLVGRVNEADEEAIDEAWSAFLLQEEEEEEDDKLPTWAVVLICVGSALAFCLIVIVPVVVVMKKKKAEKAREEAIVGAYKRKKIDTTDDKSIDVYADDEADKAPEEE